MFRMRRRWFVFLLTPAVSIISLGVGIYIKWKPNEFQWWHVFALAAILVVCAVLASYYTNIKPLLDPNSNGELLLKTIGERIIRYGNEKGLKNKWEKGEEVPGLRLNILMAERRWLLGKPHFRVRWSLEMDHSPDGAARFPIKKGVAGEAFAQRKPRLVDMEDPATQGDWGFTKKELDKLRFPKFTMIWSYPIFELDKKGKQTGRLLGTANLDSSLPGAFRTAIDDPEFLTLVDDFWNIASKICSC
jgi:hypothetical protein